MGGKGFAETLEVSHDFATAVSHTAAVKTAPPTGRTIILELVRELEERLYPLLYRVLPPAAFHVYLHPDDFRDVEPVTAVIAADAQRGLTERVQALNRRSRWLDMIQGQRPPIEVPASGWHVTIGPDANNTLQPGQIGIISRLAVPPAPQFDGGTPTTRIARTVVTGTVRQTTVKEEPATDIGTAEPVGDLTQGLARLSYVDEQGPHVFVMRKDVVSIGRGGSAHWVDIQVVAGARVSREHCRIRRAHDGRFLLQDLSTWGTSVDGQRVASFVRTGPNGQLEETGDEHVLPPAARIQLADALLIDFDVLSGR
jgi:hypothetical protein